MSERIFMPPARALLVGALAVAFTASCASAPAAAPSAAPNGAAVTPAPAAAPAAPSPAAAAPAIAPATASPAAVAAPASRASATAVHVSYLDLSRNMGELRTRVAQWQGGDEQGLSGAKERAERVEAMLKHVAWPQAFAAPMGKLATAMGSLTAALEKKDVAASKAPAEEIVDVSEDLEHAFYDKWLAENASRHTREMDVHTVYVDVSANASDLRSRIAEWEKGSGSGLSIATEKAERLRALVGGHATWPAAMGDPMKRIGTELPKVEAALTAKEVAKAKAAAAEIGEASHDLTHEVYEWLASVKATDASCVHTGFLDLTANVGDLRARIAEWEKGSSSALETATEKAERVHAILVHEQWPSVLRKQIDAIYERIGPLSAALKAKDVKAASAAAAAIGETSHDLTHEFYESSTRMD